MKTIFYLLLMAAAANAAETKQKKPAPMPAKNAPAKKTSAAKPAPVAPPPDAREVEPGTFEAAGADGKIWHYRQTPFGWVKFERPAAPATAAKTEPNASITAVEDGDLIKFERPGPFGPYRWQRKKSELNEEERAAWERAQARRAAAQ